MTQTSKPTTQAKKSPQRPRKPRRQAPPKPKHDLFTALCKSDLKVECIMEHQFHPERKWRFDYAIPSHRIALEVEGGVWTGGRHVNPKGFLGDMEKYNTATLMGWRLFRTTPEELCTKKTLKMLQEAINGMENA